MNSNDYVGESESISEFAVIPNLKLTEKAIEEKLDMCFVSVVSHILDAKTKSKNKSIDDEPIKIMLETVQLIGVLNPHYGIYIPRPLEYMKKYFTKYYNIISSEPEEQKHENKIRHNIDGVTFYTIEH